MPSASAGVVVGSTGNWDASDSVIFLTFENVLTAVTTQAAEVAFIEKKSTNITIEIATVPVPAAVWLFLSSVAGMGVVSRRARN